MDTSSKYERWASTTGLALEQEIKGWMEKCDALRAENERLRAEIEKTEKDRLNWAQPLRAANDQLRRELENIGVLLELNLSDRQSLIALVDKALGRDKCRNDNWADSQ